MKKYYLFFILLIQSTCLAADKLPAEEMTPPSPSIMAMVQATESTYPGSPTPSMDFQASSNTETTAKEKDQHIKETEAFWDAVKYGPQQGIASYYAGRFQSRRTSNGETHDNNGITAAHKHLPFGSLIRVTNISNGSDNGKSIIVKINDRGPFIRGRIIDLSKAAAKKIGLTFRNGITKVKIEILRLGNKGSMQ